MTDRLREMIIKRAVDQHKGLDVDGDKIVIFGKEYYVDCINGRVWEEMK